MTVTVFLCVRAVVLHGRVQFVSEEGYLNQSAPPSETMHTLFVALYSIWDYQMHIRRSGCQGDGEGRKQGEIAHA